MQSTHIYRASGVAVYKRKKYAVCGKGRAELPEPDFACRSFRPVGILLGSAFPAKIGGKPGRFGVQCNSSASNKSHGFLCWYEAGGAGGRHQSEPCVSRKCQRQPLRTVGCALENALYPVADFLADLHGGDYNEVLHPLVFFPTSGDAAINRTSLIAAQTLTVPYRVRSSARNGLYSWAVQKNVPALLIERGGRGISIFLRRTMVAKRFSGHIPNVSAKSRR